MSETGFEIEGFYGMGNTGYRPVPSQIASLLTPAQIFGANYYEDWDANTLSLTNGDPVSSWLSVGNNAGTINFGSGNEATYLTNQINGLPTVDFDGATSYGISDNGNAGAGAYDFLHFNGGVVIFVIKIKTTAGTRGILGNIFNANATTSRGYINIYQRLSSSTTDTRILSFNKKQNAGVINIISRIDDTSFFTVNNWDSFVQVLDPQNSTLLDRMETFLNNGSGIKTNTDNATASSGVADDMYIGARTDGSGVMSAFLTRMMFIDAVPTPTQLADLQTYLTATYGTFPI